MRQNFVAPVVCMLATTAAAQPFVPVNYQGNLERDGQPYSGVVDLRFTLYPAADATDSVVGPYEAGDVTVSDGLFFATFDLDTNGLPPQAYWIEVEVSENDAVMFEPLLPRFQYTPAAFAVQALGSQINASGENILARSGFSTQFSAFNPSPTTAETIESGAWQSFVPTITGDLREISIRAEIVDAIFIALRVYEGSGTGGELLFDEVGVPLGTSTIYEDIEPGIELVAGRTYTIQAFPRQFPIAPSSARFRYTEFDKYPEGSSSLSEGRSSPDLGFVIQVAGPGATAVGIAPSGLIRAEQGAEIQKSLSLEPFDGIDSASLQVPTDSISSLEIANDAGANIASISAFDLSNSSFSYVGTETLTLPSTGIVVAQFTATARNASALPVNLELSMRDRNGNARTQTLRIAPTAGAYTEIPIALTGAFFGFPVGSFPVDIYARAAGGSAPSDVDLRDGRLLLMYFPETYGVPDYDD